MRVTFTYKAESGRVFTHTGTFIGCKRLAAELRLAVLDWTAHD